MEARRRPTPFQDRDSSPQFIVPILEDHLRDKTLRIPRMFIQRYRGALSDPVRLEVPNGRSWQVGLHLDSKGLYLRDGLAGFMEECRVGLGYVLLFRAERDSRFFVNVFDITTCEIEYPSLDSRSRDSAEVKCPDEVSEEVCPSFKMIITKTSARHCVHVPATFARNHLPKIRAAENVKASLEYKGLPWPVALYIRECNGSTYTVLKGWQKFRKGNGFKLGEELLFELVDKDKLVLRVSLAKDAEAQA